MHDEFSFKSNPQFIFHDSPGFEAGGNKELQEVLSFLQEKAKVNDVKDQIHAIWYVLLILPSFDATDNVFRFCFTPDVSRPLLGLEQRFFNERLGQNSKIV